MGAAGAACWRRHPRSPEEDPYSRAILAINEAKADDLPMPGTEWDEDDCYVLHWLDAQENALGCRWTEDPEQRRGAEAEQARLMRELFGNPFRPMSLAPACRTSTVLTVAHAAYDERELPSGHLDNARLGVLADALEEAGCTDEAILGHLRSAGPHVRGCWALDLVLGKG